MNSNIVNNDVPVYPEPRRTGEGNDVTGSQPWANEGAPPTKASPATPRLQPPPPQQITVTHVNAPEVPPGEPDIMEIITPNRTHPETATAERRGK